VGWLAGGGGALAAILGLGLWKLRRGRLAAAGR
jgi:hypothetical protein